MAKAFLTIDDMGKDDGTIHVTVTFDPAPPADGEEEMSVSANTATAIIEALGMEKAITGRNVTIDAPQFDLSSEEYAVKGVH